MIRHPWPAGAGFLAAALLCSAFSATEATSDQLPHPLVSEVVHLTAPTGRRFYIGNDPARWLSAAPADSTSSLTFSTFLGGTNFDQVFALAVDASGNIYVTGQTASQNFPTRTGGLDGNRDVFIAKLNPAGTNFIYLTILGGQQTDTPRGIAVDVSGNVYVTGFTLSTDFPTTMGAYQTASGGPEDAFVLKLNSTGALVYSTYLGGTGRDFATGIAIDASGNAYVTGYTSSTNFPVTGGVFQVSYGGGFNDVFVTKLNSSGTGLVYSTFFGGTGDDTASSIAVDTAGNAYICGQTNSANLPVSNAFQTTNAGGLDAFVAKLNPSATALVFSTYLGGSLADSANGIAIDSSQNVYVAGSTSSFDFPVSAGAFQSAMGGGTYNAFVAKLTPAGTTLAFSTFLGGTGSDEANGLAVDSAGNVWLAGSTSSTNFPLVNALQTLLAGGKDAFVATLNSSGNQLLYSSYVGGGLDDSALTVGIDNKGSEMVGGITQSSNFSSTVGVLQPAFGGSYDGFIFKLQTGICPYSLNTYGVNAAGAGGTGTITASSSVGCAAPPASSNVSWALVAVVGNSVNWTVAANTSSIGRSGVLTIGGQTVTVTQLGLPCSYALNPTSLPVGSTGGVGNIVVTPSPVDCPAAGASSGVSWASVSISGNNAAWSVSANPSSLTRGGNFTIGSQTVSIAQSGAVCSYGLSTNTISAGPAGASGSVTITPIPVDCPPVSASSNVSWASVSTSGSMAPWTVSANNGLQSRNGAFTIGGQSVAVAQTANATPGTLTLNRTVLNYGTSAALITSPQTVAVNFAGGSGVAWTAASNQPNITVSGNGTGAGTFTITAAAGASGTVTVTAPGSALSPQQVQVNVRPATPGVPTGNFDTPITGTTGIAGAIAVTGWALDNIEVTKVDIWREPPVGQTGLAYIGDAVFIADARTDLEGLYPASPFQYRAGWGYLMLTNFLPAGAGSTLSGNGTFNLHAIAHNAAGNSLDLGKRTITVDNAHASKPFGTIDTPAQGGIVSGTAYVNFGWALTQNPYIIPINGSTITVFIDSLPVGNPTYNLYRSDIATLFPGLANSNGPIGYYQIDTTRLANGEHNIYWVVSDNQGRTDGIGSRFFSVQNNGAVAVSNEEPVLVPASEAGEISDVEIEELGRIELKLGAARGYLLVNGEHRPLPVGSSLKGGAFYWQAGPGFLGDYQLVFERPGSPDLMLRVAIRPMRFP